MVFKPKQQHHLVDTLGHPMRSTLDALFSFEFGCMPPSWMTLTVTVDPSSLMNL